MHRSLPPTRYRRFIYQIQHSAESFRNGKLESDLIPLADTVVCAGIFDKLRKQWGEI